MEEKKRWRVTHRKETAQTSMRMRKRINVERVNETQYIYA